MSAVSEEEFEGPPKKAWVVYARCKDQVKNAEPTPIFRVVLTHQEWGLVEYLRKRRREFEWDSLLPPATRRELQGRDPCRETETRGTKEEMT